MEQIYILRHTFQIIESDKNVVPNMLKSFWNRETCRDINTDRAAKGGGGQVGEKKDSEKYMRTSPIIK